MPRRRSDNRTQEQRAKDIGITGRSWRNYVKRDPRFAQLVTANADDDTLIAYLEAKKNGLPFVAPWEKDNSADQEDGDELDDLAAVARRTKVARMKKLEEEAELAEIERRKKEGTLIDVAIVAQENSRAMTALKNTIMAIGPSIRGELSQYVDDPGAAAEVEQLIVEACRAALQSASDALL